MCLLKREVEIRKKNDLTFRKMFDDYFTNLVGSQLIRKKKFN